MLQNVLWQGWKVLINDQKCEMYNGDFFSLGMRRDSNSYYKSITVYSSQNLEF